MKLKVKISALLRNLNAIKRFSAERDLTTSLMMKKQFKSKWLESFLYHENVYTNGDSHLWQNIYTGGSVVIDAFDNREGINMYEAASRKFKRTAIVNFACCNGKIPKASELDNIAKILKKLGYAKVSYGGSVLLDNPEILEYTSWYDEIRIGEAFLTGHFFNGKNHKNLLEMENPFELELNVLKAEPKGFKHRVVVDSGFLELGGFTNDIKIKCMNTDLTVFELDEWHTPNPDKLIVNPDYYTLIKYAHKYGFDNVEVV